MFKQLVVGVGVGPILLAGAWTGLGGHAASPGALAGPATPVTRTGAPAGRWGQAIELPGIAALSKGGSAQVTSISCAARGTCAVGGWYTDRSRRQQAFAADEVGRRWHATRQVPGTAALSTGGSAQVTAVSCGSAGNCAAAGSVSGRAFVADEVNGTWHAAQLVRAAGTGTFIGIESLSCPSAGNCSAIGTAASGPAAGLEYAVSEVRGRWQVAREMPGVAALAGGAELGSSLSCASPGNCAAGFSYILGPGDIEPFIDGQAGGRWQSAETPPGWTDGGWINSVSCAAPGNCAAAGLNGYATVEGIGQATVASEVHGRWRDAEQVPGTAGSGGRSELTAVSCPSPGTCAGGGYTGAGAFVVAEIAGRWRAARQVQAPPDAIAGFSGAITRLSCSSAGNCAAVGSYQNKAGSQVFVIDEINGRWGRARQVPGSASLNAGGNAAITALSCARGGGCAAGGSYKDSSGRTQAFVVTRSP
jgi:hypothetical protein